MPENITASGQTINIGNGETFENALIDCTSGGDITLHVTGTGSTIRNVGFSGLYRGDEFCISINASGGDVLVENVYLGDGGTKEGTSFVHGAGAIFYHKNGNCNMTFRNCNVQGFPNNGFYCSNTASGGSVTWENCYGKNNGVSTYRCASGNDRIINCVAHNDNTNYGPGYSTGWVESSGRPVWVWSPGGVTIEDSHLAAGDYPYAAVCDGSASMSGGAISGSVQGNLNRSGVGSSPNLSIQAGIPRSAEEAANGVGSIYIGVNTNEVTDITDTSATLSGELVALGEHDEVYVYFEHQEASADGWTQTDPELRSDSGEFNTSLEDLTPATQYVARAVASASDPRESDASTEHLVAQDLAHTAYFEPWE